VLMTRTSPARSEGRRIRLIEGLLWGWHDIFASFLGWKDGSQHERRPNSCVGMTKAERSLIIRKMASLGTPQMQCNGVNINNHFPWFDDARRIRFAMSTDDVNPFGNQSSTHSTWPVVLSLYNLPAWLWKKQKYMMLTILVSGPKQPRDRIDV
jgi:hypothetical protein